MPTLPVLFDSSTCMGSVRLDLIAHYGVKYPLTLHVTSQKKYHTFKLVPSTPFLNRQTSSGNFQTANSIGTIQTGWSTLHGKRVQKNLLPLRLWLPNKSNIQAPIQKKVLGAPIATALWKEVLDTTRVCLAFRHHIRAVRVILIRHQQMRRMTILSP